MFEPEPGMYSTVVTPLTAAFIELALAGRAAEDARKPGFVKKTVSLRSLTPL